MEGLAILLLVMNLKLLKNEAAHYHARSDRTKGLRNKMLCQKNSEWTVLKGCF